MADGERGAPTKLTPEVTEPLLRYLRAGNYVETACAAVGIHRDTFYEWVNRGEADVTGVDAGGIYKVFSDTAKKALADGEAEMAARVRQATYDRTIEPPKDGKILVQADWKAAMTFLERRYPERWGRRIQETTLSGGVTVTSKFEHVAPDEAAELVREALSGGSGQPDGGSGAEEQ